MGQPYENEFTVKVEVNNYGQPQGVIYYDQEGCGHESDPFPLTNTLGALVAYHDHHRIKSHRQKPRKERCQAQMIYDNPDTQCTLVKNHQNMTSDAEDYNPRHKFAAEWS